MVVTMLFGIIKQVWFDGKHLLPQSSSVLCLWGGMCK